ncbi:MAG: hypothetical protein RL071_2102, partial [Pseudomonadota bacterium]
DADVDVPVDYCHMQWPCTQSLTPSATSADVFVWVYQPGVTVGAGSGAGLTVQVGLGPNNGDPAVGAGWVWTTASYNADKDGLTSGDLANDEYMGGFVAPAVTGTFDYCGRVSADGGRSWLYCDLGGSGCGGSGSNDGYNAANAGALTVY